MNLANAGVSLICLKQHRQWVSNRVVEGYIANSLPLCKERLNCLLSAEEKEEVGPVNSENNNQAMERFDLCVYLSNNSNLPVAPPAENGKLTLYGFSQFDRRDLQIKNMDATNTGTPVLQATSTNQALQPVVHPLPTIDSNDQSSSVAKTSYMVEDIMAQGRIFNNCTFVIDNN